MTTKYQQIDVWWCGYCDITFLAPSVPHQPWCPKCANGSWWKRFATKDDIDKNTNIFMGGGKQDRNQASK